MVFVATRNIGPQKKLASGNVYADADADASWQKLWSSLPENTQIGGPEINLPQR